MAQLMESQGALVVIIERRDPATLKCVSSAGVMMDRASPMLDSISLVSPALA